MKNDLKKNGMMQVRFETAGERAQIVRALEELGFRVNGDLKRLAERGDISPYDSRTFSLDLKRRRSSYGLQPFIGAAMITSGVRFYSAREFFAVAQAGFRRTPRFPVFHVPHDGWRFPQELMSSAIVPEETFMRYHDMMRDKNVRDLVPRAYFGGHMTKRFEVSRLLCDVERLIGPEEEMEKFGMGFCYERAYDGTAIKRVTDGIREKTLAYYEEHHRQMDRLCGQHPRILLFDMHSFHGQTLPEHVKKRAGTLPDLCVGTDAHRTPPWLTERILERFRGAGFSCAVNEPYAGTFVPRAVMNGNTPCDLVSVMLEFNRRAYLNGSGETDGAAAIRIRSLIEDVMADCAGME